MRVVLGFTCILLFGAWGYSKEDSRVTGTATPPSQAAAANSAPNTPPDPVDLAPLKQAFASAGPAVQVYADEAIAVVRTRAYADAVEQLQKLARNPKLTAAQRQVVQDVIAKLQPLAANQRR